MSLLPVELLPRDPGERDALRAANGADLDAEHAERWIAWAFGAGLVGLVAVFLAGGS